jgi:exosortase K
MSMRLLNQKAGFKPVLQFLSILLAAGSLKLYYSAASADDLFWILWPTTRLTELVTGMQFEFESYAGYMSSDRTFLIAAPCSGVNFLIAAFVMLSFRMLWPGRRQSISWGFLPGAAVLAYVATIVANTVRISSAMWLNTTRPDIAGLGRDELHRLDGILIYFGSLLLLYVITERGAHDRSRTGVTRYLLPLGVYYATTLGIPLVNGAFRRGGEVWEHAVFVLLVPVVLIGTATTVSQLLICYREGKTHWANERLGRRGDNPMVQ